jgi:PAS domain S-box-containing protein
LRAAYDSAPVGLCVLDHELRYLDINEHLASLHGRSRPDTIGRTLREVSTLCAERLEPLLRDVVRTGRTVANIEWIVPGSDGEVERVWTVGIQAIRAEDGSITGASIALSEIIPRSRAEARLRSSETKLRAALKANELRLKEADHRIKNSLLLVDRVVQIQRRRISDPKAADALDDAMVRVRAIGQAHEAFSRSPEPVDVELGPFLRDLAGHVGLLNPALEVISEVPQGLTLDADRAIPLGLIVSELLINAARHAYAVGVPGYVVLSARSDAGEIQVTVTDMGSGLPCAAQSGGLGQTIVQGLCQQIGARLEICSTPGVGTVGVLHLPARNAAAAP